MSKISHWTEVSILRFHYPCPCAEERRKVQRSIGIVSKKKSVMHLNCTQIIAFWCLVIQLALSNWRVYVPLITRITFYNFFLQSLIIFSDWAGRLIAILNLDGKRDISSLWKSCGFIKMRMLATFFLVQNRSTGDLIPNGQIVSTDAKKNLTQW